jgi:hypothetical protein
MQALNELRQAARDRRDKAILAIRDQYEATLRRITELERDLIGREPAANKSISSHVESVIPSDVPFTSRDLLRSLEVRYPNRAWRKGAVDRCIARLREKGLVQRLVKAKGASKAPEPAVYARVGVQTASNHFPEQTLADVLHATLQGRSLTTTELTVAILEAGYRSKMSHKRLRDHAARIMRADERFSRQGEQWSCR